MFVTFKLLLLHELLFLLFQSLCAVKDYFEGLYNVNMKEQVSVSLCGFESASLSNYFGGKLSGMFEVEASGKKLNGKEAGKNEVTREMIE